MALHTDCADGSLAVLDQASVIHICSALPAVGALANTTAVSLGTKDLGVGGCFGAPVSVTGGRKVSSTAIAGGSVATGGNASHWAAVDGTRTLASGALASVVAVTAGGTFSLPSFDVTQPNQ